MRTQAQPNTQQLSLAQATKSISHIAVPFALARLAVAVNVLCNGFITSKIGPNAVAAGPEMISTVYAVAGPVRSILLTTGILIGKKPPLVKQHFLSCIPRQVKVMKTQKQYRN